MSITFNLPSDVEKDLQKELGDLNLAAKEAFLIQNYRAGRLSIGELADLLGVPTRLQAERWLGERGVTWNYSLDELEADRRTLEDLSDPAQ